MIMLGPDRLERLTVDDVAHRSLTQPVEIGRLPLEMVQQPLEDVAKQCDLVLAEEVDKVAAHGGP